jgi:hypothetical protein
VKGVKILTKQVTTHDGKPYAEWSRTEVELLETLDDKLFEKPESKQPSPLANGSAIEQEQTFALSSSTTQRPHVRNVGRWVAN